MMSIERGGRGHGVGRALTLACLLALPAFARAQTSQAEPQASQPRAARPFRALFGGNEADPTSRQALDLRASASASFDDNVFAAGGEGGGAAGFVDPRLQKAGFLSLFYGQLTYNHRGDRASFVLSTGHTLNYFPGSAALTGTAHSASALMRVALTRRVAIEASQGVSYSPFYAFGAFLAEEPLVEGMAADPNFSVTAVRQLQLFGTATITGQLSRRTSLSAEYSRLHARFTTEGRSFDSQSVGGRLSHQLTRNASLHLGYYRSTGNYFSWGGAAVTQHDIDAGVDYNRALTITKRTRFGFGTGSSVYSFGPTAFSRARTYYRLLGNAHLVREIGRSWTARADYQRGLQIVQAFPAPVFSDRVAISAAGYASYRVHLLFDAAYTNGEPGLLVQTWRFETYTGRARLQYALTRYIAASAQYLYYHYDFGRDVPMPFNLPSRLNRRAVIIGVDFWVPLLR